MNEHFYQPLQASFTPGDDSQADNALDAHFDRRPNEVKAKTLIARLTKLGYQVELKPLEKAA